MTLIDRLKGQEVEFADRELNDLEYMLEQVANRVSEASGVPVAVLLGGCEKELSPKEMQTRQESIDIYNSCQKLQDKIT